MLRRTLAAVLAVTLIAASCGNDDADPMPAPVETMNLDEVPTPIPPTALPTEMAASPTAASPH